jgi:hypothetical protein
MCSAAALTNVCRTSDNAVVRSVTPLGHAIFAAFTQASASSFAPLKDQAFQGLDALSAHF